MSVKPDPLNIPLYQQFEQLRSTLPRLPLGHWPTPIEPLSQVAKQLGMSALWVKREDRSREVCGGNKVRGLEFVLPQVLARKATTILTFGATGSHHILRTAWHGRSLNLQTVAAVVPQPNEDYVERNVRAARAAGCRYVHTSHAALPLRLLVEWLRPGNWNRRRPPYFLSGGGTNPWACIGHLNAALELKQQIDEGLLPQPHCLFVPLGSLGTAAGLLLGCKLAGLDTRIVGVTVSYRWYCSPGRIIRLARRTWKLLRRLDSTVPQIALRKSDLDITHKALGDGYGKRTESGNVFAQLFNEYLRMQLDPTYMAKTVDGMCRYVAEHQVADRPHLLWYTYQPAPEAEDVR